MRHQGSGCGRRKFYVPTSFDQYEGEAALDISEAHPNFAVHKKTVMEIDDRLPGAGTGSSLLLTTLGWKAMQAQ
jgi:hypothetical protein